MTGNPAGPRTERTVYLGQPAWIKRAEPARRSVFIHLHWLLRPLLPSVLWPTNSVGGMEGLHAEAERLAAFGAAGLSVPAVLMVAEDHLVLSDTGEPLHCTLVESGSDRLYWIKKALDVLIRVHLAGFAHGRPYIKDFTIAPDSRNVSLLDLEEDSAGSTLLPDAQARDFWLFLVSCSHYFPNEDEILRELYRYYCAKSSPDLPAALARLGKSLRAYRRLIGVLHAQRLTGEVACAYRASLTLETCAPPES